MATEISTRKLYDDYVVPNYGRYDIAFSRGKGSYVWDEDQKRYLDFGAGIAVSILGHAHPQMIAALERQARELIHVSNLYYTRPQGELAKKLVSIVGIEGKVFFSNSGAEANEAAFKLARKFGNESSPSRFEMITFHRSFHGRTMAGISATGQDKVKHGFEPLLAGFRHVPFNDLQAVEQAINAGTVGIMVEPIQGEGGIYPATKDFLVGLRNLCDEHHLLLMFDEVQCGLGRIGNWCGWKEIAGIEPDAVSWAKGIGGGFPLGATWIKKKIVPMKDGSELNLCDLFQPGSHGTTYGGTPLACTTSLAVLETIEQEGLIARARELGLYAKRMLNGLVGIKEVRGIGLMLGFELEERVKSPGKTSSQTVVLELIRRGLLTIPAGPSVVRLLPPLTVTHQEVEEAVQIIKEALEDLIDT